MAGVAYRFAKAMVRHPASHDDPPGWETLNGGLSAVSLPPRALADPGMQYRKKAQEHCS